MLVLVWECPECHEVRVSYAREQHRMNFCECDRCAVDLEEGYSRVQGKPILLGKLDDDEIFFHAEMRINYTLQIGEYDELEYQGHYSELFMGFYGQPLKVIPEENQSILNKLRDNLFIDLIIQKGL